MSHTPQKFVTVPHLVDAIQWNGEKECFDAMQEIANFELEEGYSNAILSEGHGRGIWVGGWIVSGPNNTYRLLDDSEFQAQYTPFKEELKDYPTHIINP